MNQFRPKAVSNLFIKGCLNICREVCMRVLDRYKKACTYIQK